MTGDPDGSGGSGAEHDAANGRESEDGGRVRPLADAGRRAIERDGAPARDSGSTAGDPDGSTIEPPEPAPDATPPPLGDSGTTPSEDAGPEGPLCPGFELWEVEVGECIYVKNATYLSPLALEQGDCVEQEVECTWISNVGQDDGHPIERWITPHDPEKNTSVVVPYQLVDGQCPKVCSND